MAQVIYSIPAGDGTCYTLEKGLRGYIISMQYADGSNAVMDIIHGSKPSYKEFVDMVNNRSTPSDEPKPHLTDLECLEILRRKMIDEEQQNNH